MKQPEPDHHSLTRRTLLRTGAGIAGAVAIGAAVPHVAALQIDSTPPAPPVAAPTDPIADLAAALDYDQAAIFAFVRDEIRYETYAGVLRGAKGTLWARAGNSADQAVLLGALLAASQIPYRFATGPLDDAGANALQALLSPDRAAQAAHYETVASSSFTPLGTPSATPVALSADDQQFVDELTARAEQATRASEASYTLVIDMLAGAITAAGIDLPGPPPVTLATREQQAHAWVQVSDGPTWSSLDPTGIETPPEPAQTIDAFADDWRHGLTYSIVADELSAGSISRRTVATISTTSDQTIDAPALIDISPVQALSGLGLSINQLFTGQVSVLPSILIGTATSSATQPIVFGTDATSIEGALDGGTPAAGVADGECLAVWLVVDIASPDSDPVTVERAIIDRVPPEMRKSGVIDPLQIPPISTTPFSNAPDAPLTLAEFNALIAIHVDVARISAVHALTASLSGDSSGALGVFGAAMAALRDGLGIHHESDLGVWTYPQSPNLTTFHFDTAEDGSLSRISADLLRRDRAIMPLKGVGDIGQTNPFIASGVLDANAEQSLLSLISQQVSADGTATPISIGMIMQAASDAGVQLVPIRAVDDLNGVDIDNESRARITTALDKGLVVFVPEKPVKIGDIVATGWWIVDPVTGQVIDQLADGTSGSGVGFGPSASHTLYLGVVEETGLIAWITRNARIINCIGNGVGLIATAAGTVLAGYSGSLAGYLIGSGATIGQFLRYAAACAGV